MRVEYSCATNQHTLPAPRVNGIFCCSSFFIICFFAALTFSACRRSSDDVTIMPPATSPLTREYIGYGVVNVSFAHLLSENNPDGISQGYLRRGTVVRVLERVSVSNRRNTESWLLVESNDRGTTAISKGWLQEVSLEIYSSESQAITASRYMNQ